MKVSSAAEITLHLPVLEQSSSQELLLASHVHTYKEFEFIHSFYNIATVEVFFDLTLT